MGPYTVGSPEGGKGVVEDEREWTCGTVLERGTVLVRDRDEKGDRGGGRKGGLGSLTKYLDLPEGIETLERDV